MTETPQHHIRETATLRFALERPGQVRLEVYDGRGRLVRSLLQARLEAGPHAWRWDGRDLRGRPAASGTYVARLVTPDGSLTHKMTLLR